jgi:UDP-N-acetylmuramoyl-L-alanyl-D-glutamate--2,6-diaminopimelate ligase
VLGKIAQQYCSQIIITNEDPYDEDPLEIMEQIAAGIDNQVKNYHIILDRKEAIENALQVATPEEVVIITGKGSEPLMCLAKGRKISWSDKQIVEDKVKKLS